MMAKLRTGIDLVEIGRLSRMKPSIRKRFIERVCTPREIAEAAGSEESIAGRFAVKEAVMKALGVGIGDVAWHDIEVQRGATGEPELHLSGKAGQLAEEQGLSLWSISISHTDTAAVAVAVALGLDA